MKEFIFILILAYIHLIQSISIDSILKLYKKRRLRLREDEYQGNLPILESYDYIIVGASPSGCVLANRLTENPSTTVLLLEAGPESTDINHIPLAHLLLFQTEYNWQYWSQYNPRVCKSMERETCPWASGRGIGGATSFNGMIYTRGNKKDYDEWERLGNPGWGYSDILQYYTKLENTRINNLRKSPLRGKVGPLSVSHSSFRSNASYVFMRAGLELGYPIIDYNQPFTSGFGKTQLTTKEGTRSSASNAYLLPVRNRKNLHIVQRALVSKILINSDKVAWGVEFIKKGKRRITRADKEVIVSAGAFGSPKLLMLSGIGPKEHLHSLNITVIKDAPVGNNLMEHIGTTNLVFLVDPVPNLIPLFTQAYGDVVLSTLQYQFTKKGLLSSGGVDAIGYVSSRYATDENPDIELLFIYGTYSTDRGGIIRKAIGVRDEVYDEFWKPLEDQPTMSIWIMGSYPKSRGTVRLNSVNPYDPPVINNNFLNKQEDLDVIVDGTRKSIELMSTKEMKKYNARLYEKHHPGCENMKFNSDEYWECTVRQITAQYHHQSGTCKMGPDSDPTSVVDPRLRVRGIKKLRVVDASIMPTITGGHTQAPAFMIGEKAADMIKEDSKLV